MNKEINVSINPYQKCRAFLQNGFFIPSAQSKAYHSHRYTDIHVVTGGDVVFNIEGEIYHASENNMLVIPPGIFHNIVGSDSSALHSAFQITYDTKRLLTYNITDSIICDFFTEINKVIDSQDYTVICAYITLLCSCFLSEPVCGHKISDYGFLIHEFFSNKYFENVQLCDLADELNLSERQTERLVKEYTGNTFKAELAKTKTDVAKKLMNSTNMSMQDIAHRVGYQSYAGFYKAMKKFADND